MTPREEYNLVKEFLRRYLGNMKTGGGQYVRELPELIRAVIAYAKQRSK